MNLAISKIGQIVTFAFLKLILAGEFTKLYVRKLHMQMQLIQFGNCNYKT